MLVKLLYQRGAFTLKDTLMTYRALSGYSVGLIFYALSISFGRIFNARHDMKTPARVGITSIGLNVILVYLLMMPLGNLGVALATSIVSFYNFSVPYVLYRRKTGYRPSRKTKEEIVRSLIAGLSSLSCFWACGKVTLWKAVRVLRAGVFHHRGYIWPVMHRRWVIAFASSNMRDGGPGATNILLRRQPKKQRLAYYRVKRMNNITELARLQRGYE